MQNSLVAQPKQKNWRSAKYLAWIRTLPCCHCARPADHAHHLIGTGNYGGMGMKAPDYLTMPLCSECHAELHRDWNRWPYQTEAIMQTLGKAIDTGVLIVK